VLVAPCFLLLSVPLAACLRQHGAGLGAGLRGPPLDPLNCSDLLERHRCGLRDGCSWCEGVGLMWNETIALWVGNETRCRPWQHCEGPFGLCELRQDVHKCESPVIASHAKMKPDENPRCVWCSTQNRCVSSDGSEGGLSAAGVKDCEETDCGQCMGCDSHFDSGVEYDKCAVCGGGCVATDLHLENPECKCLGCDLMPFSGRKLDSCGVCGGDNSTCSLYPVTLEEKIGVILALSGNVVISVSLNIQKYTHNLNQVNSGGEVAYTDIPLWWIGMGLMVVGETGNFLAYAYAPATLVAPLGAVTVISNCIIAYYILKEPVCKRNIAGVVLAIIGAVFIVVYAPDSQTQLTMELLEEYMTEASFIVFIVCIVLAISALFLLDEQYKQKYVVFYILICSLCGSLTVMCVKGVSTALVLTFSGQGHPFMSPLPWLLLCVLLGTTIVQIRILNLAMIHFGASEVVPVYYVLFTFCSVIGGMVLYKEYHQHCPPGVQYCHNTAFFLLGIVLTFTGVFFITFAKQDDTASSYRRDSSWSGRAGWSPSEELAIAEREGLLHDPHASARENLVNQFELPDGIEPASAKMCMRGVGPRFLASEL
jgi:drug/metabolite transporter (DMT)-like permease